MQEFFQTSQSCEFSEHDLVIQSKEQIIPAAIVSYPRLLLNIIWMLVCNVTSFC